LEETQIPTEYVTYALATAAARREMVRNAVIANMLTRNQKKTCEARGIPPEVFKEAWDEYQHTAQYEGRYFYRLELADVESSSVPVAG